MLQTTTRWLPLVLLAASAACTDGAPREPLEPTPALKSILAVSSPRCFTPKFRVTLVPTGPSTLEGLLSGDLEGMVSLEFDFGSLNLRASRFQTLAQPVGRLPGGPFSNLWRSKQGLTIAISISTDRVHRPPVSRIQAGIARSVASRRRI
jgi:hypothetical protein